MKTFFAAASLIYLLAHAALPANTKPTLYIIGDSTVKNHSPGLEGWGDPIAAYFDSAKITVENDALGGRSSRTFLTEGLWDKVDVKLKPGDFVLMQFGHNDGGSIHTSYRASLKGTGDETEDIVNPKTNKPETVHSYGWYLRQFIEAAKAKGAQPIVLSPVPRDIFGRDGKVHRSGDHDYGGFARATAEQEHVPFIDLNAVIADKYDALGPEKVKAEFFPGDHTHTDPAGAELNAGCVVEGLKNLKDCPLSQYLTAGK
jgi:lysophospholipase L1-like esterase